MDHIKIMIIEASEVCSQLIINALSDEAEICIVGCLNNYTVAFEKIKYDAPNIIIISLDLHLSTAVDLIHKIHEHNPDIGIIGTYRDKSAVSEFSLKVAKSVYYDLLQKTTGSCNTVEIKPEQIENVKNLLVPKIHKYATRQFSLLTKKLTQTQPTDETTHSGNITHSKQNEQLFRLLFYKIVVIGVSTGGPDVLKQIIPALPATFPLPILIVLHIPKDFTNALALSLDKKSSIHVKEIEDGEEVKPQTVYLAQGGLHCIVEETDTNSIIIRTNDGPPEHACKPSVDVLFRSIAKVYKKNCIAVLLTGMGEDGVKEFGNLKALGVKTLVQDEQTSLIWGMPGAAAKAGYADEIIALSDIAPRLVQLATEQ